jgi:hypothetical protein
MRGSPVPKLQIEIPHTLSLEEARYRIERFVEAAQGQYGQHVDGLSQKWSDNVMHFGFKTLGLQIDGNIGVEDGKVVVNSSLPLAAMLLKGKIESEIRSRLERVLRP